MFEAEHVLSVHNELGEGPIWHVGEQTLYWTDIEKSCYHRFHPTSSSYETIYVGQRVGALAFRKAGGLVLATENGFALWHPGTRSLEPLGNALKGEAPSQFNDGAVDTRGRFWAGTLHNSSDNSLYRLDPDGSIRKQDTGFSIPNGIGWSPDDRTMYFTDSTPCIIYAYTFEVETGSISERRVFIDSSHRPGVPDGLTVDADGYLWSARWGAGCVERYDPNGTLVQTVHVPAKFPTSVAFGGIDLSDLYVTSALTEIPQEDRLYHPRDGALFKYRSAVQGRAEPTFAG